MNTDHVKEFLTFCRTMNYSEAARELYCSRSALRQHIADLESDLGVPLVETTPAGLRLTVFGRRFRPEAEKVVAFAHGLLEEMRAMKENLLVARVSSSSLAWLHGLLFPARAQVLGRHSEKEIMVSTVAGTMTSLNALLDGASDIAVFRVRSGEEVVSGQGKLAGVRVFKLGTEQIRYFAGASNPVCEVSPLMRADLAGRRLLLTRDIYESIQAPTIDDPTTWPFGMEVVTRDFNDYQEYYAGDFADEIGSVPERFLERYGFGERPDLVVLDIPDIHVASDFYAASTEEFLANPVARELFDEMELMAGEKDA